MSAADHPALTELTDIVHTLSDIGAASALLSWDQEVTMPPRGGASRAYHMATLAGIYHEKLTAARVGELLAALSDSAAGLTERDQALVRELKRERDRAVKVPGALVKELAQAQAQGVETWRKARQADDFAAFAPALDHLVALNRRVAEHVGYAASPYDALLDTYEPGMTARAVADLFVPLRDVSLDVLRQIQASSAQIDMDVMAGEWDEERQWDFGVRVLRDMGYDFDGGRQDRSTHPFTQSLTSPFDVRITTRVERRDFACALFSSIHEGGHALYEMGFDPALARTPLANAPSLGMHESQSRLWENFVGRGLPFWRYYLPILADAFPERRDLRQAEDFYRAVNRVQPSLIRIDADEVTYNLHIILRFELERALIEGDLAVADLPAAWNEKMQRYLGITPPSDALGVMQDIHWGSGAIGYFPTYSLGNLIGAQVYDTLRDCYPDFDARVASGDLGFILAWLREHVHQPGSTYPTPALVERATGRPLDVGCFSRYLTEKFGAIYGFGSPAPTVA